MGLFGRSNTTQEAAAREVIDKTTGMGSGAEQDRYESHFSPGRHGVDPMDRLKTAATNFKGTGAEQDRYQMHFGLDEDKVKAAARKLLSMKGEGAEQDRYGSHFSFGLGADGWARARAMADQQHAGAEQDRLGSHFSLDKSTTDNAAQSMKEGVQQVRR
ncbi:hypothetical protein M011DRAFT_468447 [Sporormia fimetaria CBS 119925]|uniref:Uncharacterized protein n=1 Tax=Sporormia fimetaria CBS 119925 TaxID=1340428 RepID=A0A6A6V9I6_9PLEO|nr:hypothetical protein M011DRAFT_468447 [Sporormia fimetaria CBS 119925]